MAGLPDDLEEIVQGHGILLTVLIALLVEKDVVKRSEMLDLLGVAESFAAAQIGPTAAVPIGSIADLFTELTGGYSDTKVVMEMSNLLDLIQRLIDRKS